MNLSVTLGGVHWSVDTRGGGIDLSIPVRPYADGAEQSSAFGLPPATATLACSVDGGASVNCPLVHSLCAHSNGTHTECVGHALPGHVTLRDTGISQHSGLMPSLLLTVGLRPLGDSGDAYAPGQPTDSVLCLQALQEALAALAAASQQLFSSAALGCLQGGALILRTPPTPFKHLARWSGTNPPYLTPALVDFVLALGVQHLLVDLPSVDKEEDGGHLLAHRAWWGLPAKGEQPPPPPLCTRTITELILVPEAAADGPYLLNLQVAPLDLDAAPSRPCIFPMQLQGRP